MLHCPKCGASVDSGSVYCQNCGKKLENNEVDYSSTSDETPSAAESNESFFSTDVFKIILCTLFVALLGGTLWIAYQNNSAQSDKSGSKIVKDSIEYSELNNVDSVDTLENETIEDDEDYEQKEPALVNHISFLKDKNNMVIHFLANKVFVRNDGEYEYKYFFNEKGMISRDCTTDETGSEYAVSAKCRILSPQVATIDYEWKAGDYPYKQIRKRIFLQVDNDKVLMSFNAVDVNDDVGKIEMYKMNNNDFVEFRKIFWGECYSYFVFNNKESVLSILSGRRFDAFTSQWIFDDEGRCHIRTTKDKIISKAIPVVINFTPQSAIIKYDNHYYCVIIKYDHIEMELISHFCKSGHYYSWEEISE